MKMNKIKLGEICTIKSSKRIFEKEYQSFGIPFIRGLEISNNMMKNKEKKFECYISKERFEDLKKNSGVPKKNEILITAVGTIGNLYYIEDDEDFYFKDGNIIWLKEFKKQFYPKYIYYFMKTNYFKKMLEYFLIGAVQKALTISMLEKIEIFSLKYEKQIQVVNILEKIDKKIELNNKINSELENMAKTIYDYWFLQFEFPNEEGKPYKSSGGKMVWNEELKKEIPEGWEVKKLINYCSLKNGINYNTEEMLGKNYKIINVRNISSSTLFINDSTLDEIRISPDIANKYMVDKDDILIARSGNPGQVRIIKSNENIIYSGFIIKCKVNEVRYKEYFIYVLKKIENSILNQSNGSILKNINQEALNNLKIIIPNMECIDNFNNKIIAIHNKIKNLMEENQELISLRDYLLPLLMNGQIGFKD